MQVLTQHYDSARTGANLQETVLSPATVAPGSFGKLFELAVQGHVYAQPLYVQGVNFPGVGQRNALYVATMRNQVYAFDADAGGGPLWSRSLGPFVSLPDGNIGPSGYKDIEDAVGIISTPVISLEHQVIYVVAITHEGSQYHHRLHALDLATGEEKLGGPVAIQGSVSGTGDGSSSGTILFTSNLQNQRPALLLANDTIYVAFASYGDRDPYHGWVFGFDAGTLRQRPNIFNTTRFGSRGGIWMAGQGPAADAAGGVYLISGNGTFAQTNIANKLVLGETAIGNPALVDHSGRLLLLGWTGTDAQHHVNVIQTINGSNFTDKVTLGETSIDGPALASGNDRVFLSWTGTDGAHSLNVSSSTDLRNFGDKVTLGERSNHGPALAFGNGRLFLAWTGLDQRLNILSSTNGVTFGNKVTLGETSDSAPGLAFDSGTLFLLWRGIDPNHRLNILQSTDGVTFTDKVTLADTSNFHPALTRHAGKLRLSWTGRDSGQHLNLLSGQTPTALGSKDTYGDSARAAPALAVLGNQLFVSWTGTDSGAHLNLARLVDDPSLGDSFIKLARDLTLADWFSPWNTQALNEADNDLGSGGALVLPGTGLIVGGGKEGKLYVLDPNALGHFCSTCGNPAGDTQIVQWFQATGTNKGAQSPPQPAQGFHHIHGSPVFWRMRNGGARIYIWGEADWLRAFRLSGRTFDPTPVDISDVTTPALSMPGGMLTVSANGDQDDSGIIWASHPISENANQAVVPGMVRAIDASNLRHELWSSTMRVTDDIGMLAKFTPPTVANGKVYVATFSNKICVFGRK
ncbi:MAG: hypothetical protein JO272_07210 [Pseudonocardiales bacterium]|nr:hypothetical protein [Pseudonocardiales bacterium]